MCCCSAADISLFYYYLADRYIAYVHFTATLRFSYPSPFHETCCIYPIHNRSLCTGSD